VFTRAVKDLKISVDKFATQITTLEDKVKHLEDKVEHELKEVRTWKLCLENARLTKKLESKSFGCF
jgi:outer membrane murein-binding lipoprotein Lpp